MSELEATVDASANTARALPKEDPRYTQGCVFIEEGKYDEAIELLNSLMESAAQEYGDKALELAPVWYKYGYALLGKEEESPSDDLMGVARRNMTEAAGLLRSDGADEDKVDEEDVRSALQYPC